MELKRMSLRRSKSAQVSIKPVKASSVFPFETQQRKPNAMAKRIIFSKFISLPGAIDRDALVAALHDHAQVIELNPYVLGFQSIPALRDAPAEERREHRWYELREDISHLTNGSAMSLVSYKACFHNLHNGVDFHIYGPLGLDIKERWTISTRVRDPQDVAGTQCCLQLRRDCNVKSNVMLSTTTEANIYNAHQLFIDGLANRVVPATQSVRSVSRTIVSGDLRSLARARESLAAVNATRLSLHDASASSGLDVSDLHPAFRNDVDWSLLSSPGKNGTPRSSTCSCSDSPIDLSAVPQPLTLNRNHTLSRSQSFRSHTTGSYRDSASVKNRFSSSTVSSIHSLRAPKARSPLSGRVLRPGPADYVDLVGNPHAFDEVSDVDEADRYEDEDDQYHEEDWEEVSSPAESAPSLVDETSDEETPQSPVELDTPLNDCNPVLCRDSELHQQSKCECFVAPPVPRRASGHIVSSRSTSRQSSIAPSQPVAGFAIPLGLLPNRSTSIRKHSRTSMSRTHSMRSSMSKKLPALPAEIEVLETDEMERKLGLLFSDAMAM